MQTTAQSEPVCTGDCTSRRITVVGVRGGSGASTVAAALSLISRTVVHIEILSPRILC